jgi:hypothetical protein
MARHLMPLLLALGAMLVVPAPALANVSAGPTFAEDVTATEATVTAGVVFDEPVTYHFEYGTTTALGSSTPDVQATPTASPSQVQARERLRGLSPGTRHFARIVVTAASGTYAGEMGEFSTQPAPVAPDGDRDGEPDASDPCRDAEPFGTQGKPGCPALYWLAAHNYPASIQTTVENKRIEVFSRCRPGLCTTRFTLTAGKRARKQLGLKEALLLRETATDRYFMFHGQRRVASASFKWKPSSRVLKRLAKLDRLELKVKLEVSAADQPEMAPANFTRSGTLVLDRRPTRTENGPKGQGLRLLCGDQVDRRLPDSGPCEN